LKVEIIQILFFCFVLLGIFLLIFSIKNLKKRFFGETILELVNGQKNSNFTIKESGYYAIWYQGKLFKKNPFSKYNLFIKNINNQEEIKLKHSLLKPNTSGLSTGKIELFHFSLKKGNYQINLLEKTNTSINTNVTPQNNLNANTYALLIKKSQPFFTTLLFIVLTIISALIIIGGFIMVLLAEKIVLKL